MRMTTCVSFPLKVPSIRGRGRGRACVEEEEVVEEEEDEEAVVLFVCLCVAGVSKLGIKGDTWRAKTIIRWKLP